MSETSIQVLMDELSACAEAHGGVLEQEQREANVFNYMVGALYALEQTDVNGGGSLDQESRSQPCELSLVALDQLRQRRDIDDKQWLGRFWLNTAIHRIDAAFERLAKTAIYAATEKGKGGDRRTLTNEVIRLKWEKSDVFCDWKTVRDWCNDLKHGHGLSKQVELEDVLKTARSLVKGFVWYLNNRTTFTSQASQPRK